MWRLPTKILFAEGETVKRLPKLVNSAQNAVLVTDNGILQQTQWVKQIVNEFEANSSCKLHIYSNVPPNPYINTTNEI